MNYSILRRLRENHNLTQEQVSRRTGIPYRSYRRYEYGERFPKPEAIVALAALYSYPTPGDLFNELIGSTSATLYSSAVTVVDGGDNDEKEP